jgi:hypothetical protein
MEISINKLAEKVFFSSPNPKRARQRGRRRNQISWTRIDDRRTFRIAWGEGRV